MKKLDRKSRKKFKIIVFSFSALIVLILFNIHAARNEVQEKVEPVVTKTIKKVKTPAEAQLDVPLESQFSETALNNGCEVTALSMLLNYYGYKTNKNALAKLVYYVPVYVDYTHRGNPHDGFVGDMADGEMAMGMDVEPTAKVAEQVVGSNYKVIQSQETTLDDLLKVVSQKKRVWVKVTQEFVLPNDYSFSYWNTTSGKVKVTPLNHACVITGYDEDSVFVNDPYGHKNREIDRDDFEYIFDAMGRQSLYLK